MIIKPAWADLASDALAAVVLEEYKAASAAVNRLGAEHGYQVIPVAMCAWIDFTARFCWPVPTGVPVGLKFRDEITGELCPVDDMHPDYRWAGRVLVARVSRDLDQFNALISSVPDDKQWSACVAALLNICGTELRVRGYRPPTHLGEDHS